MRRAAAACLIALMPACREPARDLARGAEGRAAARTLVQSLALRFGPVQRDAALEALRPKLERSALVPSRIFDDAGAWPDREGERRAVGLTGYGSPEYHIDVRGEPPPPAKPGEYRGRVQLLRTGGGRYQWDVSEELAVGPVRIADLSAALDALLRATEGIDGVAARAAVRHDFPRAGAALGRLLRLETLALWPEGGGTRVDLGVRLVPDALAATAPRLARYVSRYFGPMTLRAVARDRAGREWWVLAAGRDVWSLQLRVRDGSLVPVQGSGDGRIPGDLRVEIDFETRMGRFRVGARRIVAGVTLVRTPAEKGFVARFLQEPDWQLPFLVEPLLHGPLAHPFEPPGSEAGFWAREERAGETELVRSYRFRVRETFVLRWLSGLTSTAMADFREGAESELAQWTRESLLAIRDDLEALDR